MSNMFLKYPSLMNHYQEKEIGWWLERHPELAKCKYSLTEKIHGCFQKNTKINLADGTTETIGNIVNNKLAVELLGVNELGQVVPTKILNYTTNGKETEWIKLTVANSKGERGSSIKSVVCTKNHKIFSVDKKGYVACSELKAYDKVIIIRNKLHLTFVQQQILIGKMLGDGSFGLNAISFGHKKEHEDYITYTLHQLGNIAGNRQKDMVSGYGSLMCRARTISSYTIKELFSDWFIDGKKVIPKSLAGKLSPIALAYHYMDDGSLTHNEGQEDRIGIAMCGFDEESISNYLLALKQLGICGEKHYYDYWRVSFTADESDKIFSLIIPYVPKCMQYKLPERYRGNNVVDFSQFGEYKKELIEQEVVSVKDYMFKGDKTKYDIETGTHNYFANGILVHNSNISLIFPPSEEMRVAKRTCVIGNTDGFYGVFDVLKTFEKEIAIMQSYAQSSNDVVRQSYAQSSNDVVRFHGELFGSNIQKGVFYGKEKTLRIFDISIGDELIAPFDFKNIMVKIGLGHLCVPHMCVVDSLQEALDFDVEVPSPFGELMGYEKNETNIMEGIVIKPYLKVFTSPQGSLFAIKKKSLKFLERKSEKKIKITEGDPVIANLNAEFMRYITDARIDNVFSKHHPITSVTELGKFIRLVLEDAKEEFMATFEDEIAPLDKKQQRDIFNVGSTLASMLKKRL